MALTQDDLNILLRNVQNRKVTAKAKKPGKYRNEKVEYDGEKFDSKKELARYKQLLMLEKSGVISDLQKQVRYRLEVNGKLVCAYVADFTYQLNGALVVEDTKSVHTRTLPVYRIKKKLMAAIYNIEIKES